jgi:hypothetical protein
MVIYVNIHSHSYMHVNTHTHVYTKMHSHLHTHTHTHTGRGTDGTSVLSIHPDGQLDSDCLILPLDGPDCDMQVSTVRALSKYSTCTNISNVWRFVM